MMNITSKQVKQLVDFANKILNSEIKVSYYDGVSGICQSEPTFTFKNPNLSTSVEIEADQFNFYAFTKVLRDLGMWFEYKYSELETAYKLI